MTEWMVTRRYNCIQRGKAFTYTANNNSIAFKPAESGWGSGTKYSQNYDNIFSKKMKIKTDDSRDEKLTESTNGSDEN